MNSRYLSKFSLSVIALSVISATRADVRLPALFSEGMVLQQNIRVPIWGWADEGEDVAVTFRGRTVKTKAKEFDYPSGARSMSLTLVTSTA